MELRHRVIAHEDRWAVVARNDKGRLEIVSTFHTQIEAKMEAATLEWVDLYDQHIATFEEQDVSEEIALQQLGFPIPDEIADADMADFETATDWAMTFIPAALRRIAERMERTYQGYDLRHELEKQRGVAVGS